MPGVVHRVRWSCMREEEDMKATSEAEHRERKMRRDGQNKKKELKDDGG